jgi:hypothetical protein
VQNIQGPRAWINLSPSDAFAFFDKLGIRTPRSLTEKQMQFLHQNAASVDVRYGRPLRNSDAALILTVVNPNERALQFMAERRDFVVNYLEPALDLISQDEWSKNRLRDLFDDHFVQLRHGRRETVHYGQATYTGQRHHRVRFVWYDDKPSKVCGAPHCLHVEGRHKGAADVRTRGRTRASATLSVWIVIGWRTGWSKTLNPCPSRPVGSRVHNSAKF